MSSVTASVLIGTNHPNDNNICPTHLALLHEGSRATWVLHHLLDPRPPHQAAVRSPETVVSDLATLIERQVLPLYEPDRRPPASSRREVGLELPGLALAVTTFHQSLLGDHLDELRALQSTEVTVAEQTWQRYRSSWTGDWTVTD